MVMVSTLDGEVDEEVQPGEETAARSSHGVAAAAAHGGGGGSPRRRRPLTPFLFLGDGVAMEELLSLRGCCQEEENSWLSGVSPKTRVSSLYIGGDNASRSSDGWLLDPMALGHL